MPGWHEAVKDLVASKQLVLLGVTEEQHAERCRLFAKWKGLDWTILHDPINLLGSKAVPLVTAIDEHGIVQSTNPTYEWIRHTFVTKNYPPRSAEQIEGSPSLEQLKTVAQAEGDAASYRHLGDAAMLWHRADPDLAVDSYRSALQQENSAIHHFRLGVALRRRHETPQRQQADFSQAVSHWTTALEMDPNQYIWRRRIQQYGPRLDKPYPFYDWVEQANADIIARGEEPVKLTVALSGAEIAQPSKKPEIDKRAVPPDPTGRITRDQGKYVRLQVVPVPAQIVAGQDIRVHMEFRLTGEGLWNNEAEPLTVWLNERPGWRARHATVQVEEVPPTVESDEVRRLEVEFQSDRSAKSESITGFALYYICDKTSGTCLFRRQDFNIQANIR